MLTRIRPVCKHVKRVHARLSAAAGTMARRTRCVAVAAFFGAASVLSLAAAAAAAAARSTPLFVTRHQKIDSLHFWSSKVKK